jgi:NHLM bacteriocin system ABC transporter ATP-binding protein
VSEQREATTGPDETLRVVEGNSPLLLDNPALVWRVEEGSVDLFAIPLQDGAPSGARHYLFSTPKGGYLFGFEEDDRAAKLGILAVGTVGTQARPLAVADLAPGDELAAALDAWITGLSAGAVDHQNIATGQQLTAGQTIALKDDETARPAEGVVWITLRSGAARFMEDGVIAATEQRPPLPLAEAAWLRAVGDASLSAGSTPDAIAGGEWRASLTEAHRLLLDRITRQMQEDETEEADRLRRELDHDRLVQQRALQQLASVINDVQVTNIADLTNDPLFDAMQLVASEMRMTLRRPAGDDATGHEDHLQQIARASRIRTRQVTLKGQWWRGDSGPILGFTSDGEVPEPVALIPSSAGHYELVRPADLSRTAIDASVASTVDPVAWTLYRPFPDRAMGVRDIFRFSLAGARKDLVRIATMGLLTGLLALLPPLATGAVFGQIIPRSDQSRLLQLAGVLVLSALSIALFQIAGSLAVTRVEARVDASLQPAVWDRLLRLPTGFFRQYSAGNLASRAMAIDTARQILTGTAISSVLASVFSVFSLVLLFYYDIQLALIAMAFVLVALLVTAAATVRQLRLQRRMTTVQANISGMVLQYLTGIAKLRVAGAEARAYGTWADVFTEQKKLDLRTQQTVNAFSVFGITWPVLGTVAIFGYVASTNLERVPTATLLAFLVAFAQFMTATLMTATAISSVLQTVPLYEQAQPIFQAMPEVKASSADPGPLTGAIEISHVSFRYTKESPLALNDVSMKIEPGEFAAFVGPSGAGKSSILRLLLGFDSPEAGAIYYDGMDLAELDSEAVRRQLGVVIQESKVLPGTIFANIAGASLATIDDAWAAAKLAGLDDDIRHMPMGMETVISEGGGTFSGGQLQRLMIARALVRKPRILFFDEATSALDNRTQAIVSESLDRMQATRIVIAHRLSTIQHADRIFVLEAGRLVQQGTYDELISAPGPFADLAKRQLA